MNKKFENKWRIELTEHQLMLLARCVEDCCRFIAGQTELSNSTVCLKEYRKIIEELEKLQPLIAPDLGRGGSYGWSGSPCPNDNQRKFIAETYYLYREIYHQVILNRSKNEDIGWNVYLGETLTCEDSGEPIKLEKVD